MKTAYDTQSDFAHKVKTLLALSFVPPTDVTVGFDEICANVFDENDDVDELLDYFEKEYVGEKTRYLF